MRNKTTRICVYVHSYALCLAENSRHGRFGERFLGKPLGAHLNETATQCTQLCECNLHCKSLRDTGKRFFKKFYTNVYTAARTVFQWMDIGCPFVTGGSITPPSLPKKINFHVSPSVSFVSAYATSHLVGLSFS